MKRIWNVRRDQRGTTHFKFDREDALRWFMAEIYQWPQVFRSFQDYYDIGEKIGACKVYKALIYLSKRMKRMNGTPVGHIYPNSFLWRKLIIG